MTSVFATQARGSSGPGGPSPGAGSSGGPVRHEQVVFCQDPRSGLRAIIALYSTALGPGLGGTRFYPYPDEDAALADALNLSRAMAYKNALAGLDHGGGKAVIIGDPATDKSEALLRAYGRFVESLSGRYITACDIGTYSEDMDIIARESRHVTGRTVPNGGAGDSSVLTAFGVFQGMRAAAEHLWGSPSLEGRLVGVEGVGKVGRRLVDHLTEAGGTAVIYDEGRAPSAGSSARTLGFRWPRPAASSSRRNWTSSRPARWAGRWTTTAWRRCVRASYAAGPTTSWRTRGSRRSWRTAASCTRPTT